MITNPFQKKAYDAVAAALPFAVDPSKITVEPGVSYLPSPIKLHDYAAGVMAAFGSVVEHIGRNGSQKRCSAWEPAPESHRCRCSRQICADLDSHSMPWRSASLFMNFTSVSDARPVECVLTLCVP